MNWKKGGTGGKERGEQKEDTEAERKRTVVKMGVVSTGQLKAGVERLAHEAGEALLAESKTGLNELDVGAAAERIGNDLLTDCLGFMG